MNTYFILGVVACMVAIASTVDPETPTSREARLFGLGGGGGGGWGWPKRRPIETVFITYPKKGWGWQGGGVKHGIHHYHASEGHGHGGGGGGGWGWQPKVHVIPKHIHLPGGHFEEPGWGWEGWSQQGSYGAGGGWGWGGGQGGHGGYGKKGHKKGGHGGGGHGGWGWQDPWRSDVPSSAEFPARHLEVEESSELEPLQPYADDVPFPYDPNYAPTYGEDY